MLKVAVVVLLRINVLLNIDVSNFSDNKLLVDVLLKYKLLSNEPPFCKFDIAEICDFLICCAI